jgi:hypothetical protein
MKKLAYLLVLALAPACLFICCNNTAGSTGNAGDTGSSAGAVTGSGGDLYFEETLSGGGSGMAMNGMMKMFFASSGKIRMEMNFGVNRPGGKGGPIVSIGDLRKTNESITIDDSLRTYTINHIDTGELTGATGMKSESTVRKVGDESILGFHCVHAQVISNKSIGSFYHSKDTTDLWESMDVPMADMFKKWMDTHKMSGLGAYDPKAVAQLKQIGCEGFPVKMVLHSDRSSMTMALTKVEHRSLPGSLFEIPSGYKEVKE